MYILVRVSNICIHIQIWPGTGCGLCFSGFEVGVAYFWPNNNATTTVPPEITAKNDEHVSELFIYLFFF